MSPAELAKRNGVIHDETVDAQQGTILEKMHAIQASVVQRLSATLSLSYRLFPNALRKDIIVLFELLRTHGERGAIGAFMKAYRLNSTSMAEWRRKFAESGDTPEVLVRAYLGLPREQSADDPDEDPEALRRQLAALEEELAAKLSQEDAAPVSDAVLPPAEEKEDAPATVERVVPAPEQRDEPAVRSAQLAPRALPELPASPVRVDVALQVQTPGGVTQVQVSSTDATLLQRLLGAILPKND